MPFFMYCQPLVGITLVFGYLFAVNARALDSKPTAAENGKESTDTMTQPRKLDHVKCEFSQTNGKKAEGWLRRDTKKNLRPLGTA